MISILEQELVANKRWLTADDMLDMLVIAESTPGVIAVNTATSVGYRLRGFLGALIATLGVVLPSFVIITALSFAINWLQDNRWYQAAFVGVQACVCILVVNAFIKMAGQLERSWFSAIMALASFAVALFTKFNVIFVILIGAVVGIVYSLIVEAVVAKRKAQQLPLEESERLSSNEKDVEQPSDGSDSDGGEQ